MTRLSCIVAIICVAFMCVIAEELYDSKFDVDDIKALLENDQERDQHYNCFMDKAPCTEAQKLRKVILFDIINVGCGRCTEKQKFNIKYVTEWYEKNKPEEWQRLIEKAKSTSSQ